MGGRATMAADSAPRTQFWVLRHGQTDYNVERRLQGQRESRLTELGRRQADGTGRALAAMGLAFDACYCSPLRRARETAELVAARLGLRPIPDPRLQEWCLGQGEGLLWDEAAAEFPQLALLNRRDDPELGLPGGETRRQLWTRVGEALEELAARHAGQRLLLVSHGGAIRAMFHHVCGDVPAHAWLPQVDNASLSRFEHRGDAWRLLSFNETAFQQIPQEISRENSLSAEQVLPPVF